MNEAFPKRFFDEMGLVSLLDYLHETHGASEEPPCTEPYARWCERGEEKQLL